MSLFWWQPPPLLKRMIVWAFILKMLVAQWLRLLSLFGLAFSMVDDRSSSHVMLGVSCSVAFSCLEAILSYGDHYTRNSTSIPSMPFTVISKLRWPWQMQGWCVCDREMVDFFLFCTPSKLVNLTQGKYPILWAVENNTTSSLL